MIDINKLSKAQLKDLNAQITAMAVGRKQDRAVWTSTVTEMLLEKDESGNHVHTTVDIWSILFRDGVETLNPVDVLPGKERDSVLKKIQAYKQKLAKSTDKATGNLIHPTGSLGYKATESSLTPRSYSPEKVTEWFTNADNVAGISLEQKKAILASLKGVKGVKGVKGAR